MRFLALTACSVSVAFSLFAQVPQTGTSDVWGKSPPGSDDRFSNPKSKLYAGPDGWFNTGEVRATVSNVAKTAYKYTGRFQSVGGDYLAMNNNLVLIMEFGSSALPKPGTYKVTSKGDAAEKTVHFSFSDISDNQFKEWAANDGAGTLTISLVNGFTYFTCRNVVLQPTDLSNKVEMKKPMTLGFEGALPPESLSLIQPHSALQAAVPNAGRKRPLTQE